MTEGPQQLFLYTDDAKPSEYALRRLRKSGILPIKVSRLDAVKLISAPIQISAAEMDAVTRAALGSIESGSTFDQARFAAALIKALRKPPA